MDNLAPLREQGFQVFREILEPEAIAGVREFLEAEESLAEEDVRKRLGIPSEENLQDYVENCIASGQYAALEFEYRQFLVGHFPLKTRLSQKLWSIPRSLGLRTVLRSWFEDEHLFMHMPPTARWVRPHYRFAAVPAHQDIAYNHHLSGFVTVWVPLVEIDEACGGVGIYAGSHVEPERPVSSTETLWFEGLATEGFRLVRPIMRPGDVLVFNPMIIHASMPNVSQRTRYSIDFRFFSALQESTKHYLDLQSMEVIAPNGKH